MNKWVQGLTKLVVPEVVAKATPVKGRCINGCSGDGAYSAAKTSTGKVICC